MKTSSRVVNSSSRAVNNAGSGLHQVSQSPRGTGSQTQRSSILVGGSNRKLHIRNKRRGQAPRKAVQVFDDDGNDVTPLPLYHAEPGDMQCKPGQLFLDEIFSSSGSDHLKSTSASSVASFSSLTESIRQWTTISTDSFSKLDIPINRPAPFEVLRKRDNVKQHVTEEMLDEEVDVYISETDTISLLDIPPIFISEDADDAENIKERNIQYAALCKHRVGNDKYVGRSAQTFKGGHLNKQTQTDETVTVNEGTSAFVSDIYDSFCDQSETPKHGKAGYPESTMNTSKGQQERGQQSRNSTVSNNKTGSKFSSQLEMESDLQLMMFSESFQHSLFVMQKIIVTDVFQPKLAVYRQLPALGDPDNTVKSRVKEQSEEGEESSLSPTLERLWAFSCKLTNGCNITSMALNKENQDLLAVGYSDDRNHRSSLICCWCLRNPLQPERVFHCHSCVTSLDFSVSNPNQLAAGMYDGTVAVYNVQSQDSTCIDSSKCSRKHLYPVWQVNWTKQRMTISGSNEEALVSGSEDGRISKWFFCSQGLDCKDLILLENQNRKKNAKEKRTLTKILETPVTSCRCFDFHPKHSHICLAGTREGPIHKCSIYSFKILDTYLKHSHNVNHIEWSPFNPDVFLSCSNSTIQLWRQDRFTPVLSIKSTKRAVHGVRWSPNWSTIFAAINGQQVEIWDLNSSILQPTIVHHVAAGVKMTSLLFAKGTDCLLVGDSDGQVTVYQLKNLNVGEGKQVKSLEDIIRSAIQL